MYIKMDAHDQLLLSGGVCRQLHWLDDVYGIRDYSLGEAVQTTIIALLHLSGQISLRQG